MAKNNYPKLHNAGWPGVVGKGGGGEPPIDLDTMLDLTAAAEVDGEGFYGMDLFLHAPHVDIDIDDDGLQQLAEKFRSRRLVVGTVVAPVWKETGGRPAMDRSDGCNQFLVQVRKACRIAQKLTELDIRPYGNVRIDSATSVADWAKDPDGNTERIAETFGEACFIAEECDQVLVAEAEACWGGLHSYQETSKLLKLVNRPEVLGFQADMAHVLSLALGINSPTGHRILPDGYDWEDKSVLDRALMQIAGELRPLTKDIHIAQSDGTIHGSGTHDKTGRHCVPTDPDRKLDITKHAGYWLDGAKSRGTEHICWDGCMFSNKVMMDPKTWNDVLGSMIAVRDAHGWD
jgi:sugar phosphate isomerase/epimerase